MAKKPTFEELEQRVKELENEAFDRKHAEKVLLEYRKAVEGSEELITAVDRQYVYSLANEAFLRYHCLSRDQVIDRDIAQVIGKEIFQSIIKPNAERCFKGEPVDFEMKHNYPEYGERYMLVSNYPLQNDDGEVAGMVVVARDVTVSKMAAEGLRESEEKYHSLVEATSDWIWEVDNDGVYTYSNFKIKDILGYEPEEIIGKTPFDFMVPNEQERLTEWFRDILESRKPFEGMENTNIHKDGRHVLLETSGVPFFDTDGNLLGYRGIDRDITRRKQTKEVLQKRTDALAERVKELNCLYGISNLVEKPDVSLDEIIQGVVGLIPPSWQYPEITYSRILLEDKEYKTENFKETNWKQSSEILVHGKRMGVLEVCYLKERPENDEGPFLKEERDLINAITERLGDIIERMRAREEKERLEAQLQQAQKMETLGTLVAGVAHEINNPINLIMLNVPLLEKIWEDFLPIMKEHTAKEPDKMYGGLTRDFLIENLSKLISDMDMAASRVAKIIADLKNFARQSDVTEKKSVQINTAVENALRLAKSTLRKSGVAVRNHLESDLPPIKGDLQTLEQITLNLIINAVQAIDHDEGKVEIVSGIKRKDKRVFLSVSDNGRGIDPSISNRIFDPFFTDRQAEGGTGLGLSITHSLVKDHEGKIVFQSQKGEGTTFTVSFPTTLARRTAKILVVDDEEEVRNMVAEILTRDRPYLVDTASNGTEACIKLGTYRPDLIILDVLMPEMDGLEVCRNIRTEPELSGTKVMVITGFSKDPRVKEIQELGFDHIYLKPLKSQELLSAVDDILKRPNP